MRNLKRALSLALASVMVIGMMVVGASAASYDDFSDKDEIVNKEAVQMLVELGVINGKDDGSYDPTGIVTRAEMAKMICVVLNGGNDPSLGSTVTNSYTDTVGHWAAGYIEYCTQLGIVAGDGAGNFNPNATVTGSEAAKMLLVAMGYKSEVEGFTGANWALAVNTRGSQKGLYNNLDIVVDQGLSRDDAAQMIYNALDANMVEYTYTLITDGSSLSSSPTLKDKVNNDGNTVTLLEDRFNAVKVEGVVIANEYATLSATSDKGSALDEGKTKVVITNGDDQNTYTGTETFAVSTGADELAHSVAIYVKKNSNAAKAEVLGSVITSADNVVVKDTSDDSIADVADDNDLTFDANAQIAYNYGKVTDLTKTVREADGTTGKEKFLIDVDDDGEIDYVLVNTMYFGQVSKYSTKDDGSITIDINKAWTEDDTASNLTADDKDDVVGFDDVAEGDYVMAGWIGGKLYVSVADSVTGVLDSIKANDSLTVDGTKYTSAEIKGYRGGDDSIVGAAKYADDDIAVIDTTYLDVEATFYLDANGLVVAVGDAAANAGNYAYVWGFGTSESGIDSDRVKVTLQDGTTKTYTMTSNSATGKLTTNTADSGNRIYAYSINSDGEIKLSLPKNGNAADASTDFTKGKTTVGTMVDANNVDDATQTNYANSSTVFFYVSTKKDNESNDVIDSVSVYTGYTNAPSVEGVKAEAAYNNAGKMAAVSFTGGTVAIKDVADALYITSVVSNSSDYSTVKAVLAGSDEAVEIKVNDSNLSDSAKNKIYLYSVDSDGNYDLKTPAEAGLTSDNYEADANVASISSTTVVTGVGEYKLTDETVWVEQTSKGAFDDANIGKLPSNADRATVTAMLYNNDGEIIFIVTKAAATQTEEKPTVGDYTANATVEGSDVVVRYYKTEPNALQIGNILNADLKDYTISDYDATQGTVKVNGITLNVETQEVFAVTYGSDVTYVDKNATPAINTIVKTEGVEKVWDGSAAKTVASDSLTAVTADITLTAMYKVTVTGLGSSDKIAGATSGTEISSDTSDYMIAGETVNVTNTTNEIKKEGTTVSVEDGAESFKMPSANVTVTFGAKA